MKNTTEQAAPLTVGQALRNIAAEALERRRLAAEKNRSREDCGTSTTPNPA